MMTSRRPALLVADAPGHIIDRMGRSWLRHSPFAGHELLNTGVTSSFAICQRARQLGVVHWLDQVAYLALGKAVRAPQVVMVHHLTDDVLEQGVASLAHCDAIATSSLLWQSRLEAFTGRPVVRIPYSVDTTIFCPPADRQSARAAAGFGPHHFVAGFLGKAGANQANRKGLDVLEAAVRGAAERIGNFALLLVGPGWELLAQRLRAAGVTVMHRQYATTEETAAAYAAMDALLVTSSEEGGPCTILEAMSIGVPVVTSVVGHVPEIISDGRTGFTCPTRTAREYVERLELLAGDVELRRRVAQDAREFVLRERADHVVIPRIDFATLYEGAIQRFRTRKPLEMASRMVPSACLFARSLARPLVRAATTVQSL
jgi:glycosyltransferase involved in cell wall biosynthesis